MNVKIVNINCLPFPMHPKELVDRAFTYTRLTKLKFQDTNCPFLLIKSRVISLKAKKTENSANSKQLS